MRGSSDLCSGGGLMMAGMPVTAARFAVLASIAFVAINVAMDSRQGAEHIALLLTGAAAWSATSCSRSVRPATRLRSQPSPPSWQAQPWRAG